MDMGEGRGDEAHALAVALRPGPDRGGLPPRHLLLANDWSDLRADLAPRELSDALDQCEEAANALERMSGDGTTCDELRALYLDP